jgi:hypothetical protein
LLQKDSCFDWARQFVDDVANDLAAAIPGAATKSAYTEAGGSEYASRYVHFRDWRLWDPLALWVYAAGPNGAYNFGTGRPILAVGLMHDSSTELNRDAAEARFSPGFMWRKHQGAPTLQTEYAGFRMFERLEPTAEGLEQARKTIAARVLRCLNRADAIEPPGPVPSNKRASRVVGEEGDIEVRTSPKQSDG